MTPTELLKQMTAGTYKDKKEGNIGKAIKHKDGVHFYCQWPSCDALTDLAWSDESGILKLLCDEHAEMCDAAFMGIWTDMGLI